MKRLTLDNRTEVLPALGGRAVAPVEGLQRLGAKLRFDSRATRTRQFPVAQSLARMPEQSGLGRFLDVEV